MMVLVYLFTFFSFLHSGSSLENQPIKEFAGFSDRACKVFGAVYLERDPAKRSFASYTVYEEQDDAFADVVIFEEENKLFADGPGLWFITKDRAFANHILFVTTNRQMADFSVAYTKVRSFAGCRR